MATIYPRINKDGSKSYRVQIRRKGLKKFSTTFNSEHEALKFVSENEEKYCLNPDSFGFDKLLRKRMNEFNK